MHVSLFTVFTLFVTGFFVVPALAESEEAWSMARQIQLRPDVDVDEAIKYWHGADSVKDPQILEKEVKDILEASRRTKIKIPRGIEGWHNLVGWLKRDFGYEHNREISDQTFVKCKRYMYEGLYDEWIDDETILMAVKFARELEAMERGVPETPAAETITPKKAEPAVAEEPKSLLSKLGSLWNRVRESW